MTKFTDDIMVAREIFTVVNGEPKKDQHIKVTPATTALFKSIFGITVRESYARSIHT